MASLRALLMFQCSVLLLWMQLASAKNSPVHPSPPPAPDMVPNCTAEGLKLTKCDKVSNTDCYQLKFGKLPIFTCLCKKGYARDLRGQGCQKMYDPKCDPNKVRDGCLAPPPKTDNESFPRSKFNKIVAGK
ncbi:hypothetical protein MKW98_014991 [Papaver atlanticum]|uniref:Uncharacterized protein n=1 Tax=Papaver atlanticum TaxID=357466 RepID=A0AAD4SMG5_9MAGN|nr:hypothetical protein MKW98_014991 [Papaver atlanticum]